MSLEQHRCSIVAVPGDADRIGWRGGCDWAWQKWRESPTGLAGRGGAADGMAKGGVTIHSAWQRRQVVSTAPAAAQAQTPALQFL